MSGENAQQAQPKSSFTEIAYCPYLDLYRHVGVDGTEYTFSTAQLEKVLQVYLDKGQTRDADFMSLLTGMARQYPHVLLKFDGEGNCNVTELVKKEPSSAGGEDSASG